MEEIWKDIPGYEKYYMASTLGRINGVLNHIIIHMELASNVHLKNKDLLIQIA